MGTSWKAAELRVARRFGTRRLPCDGSRAGADFITPVFAVQLKCGRRRPGYLAGWLSGIVGTAASLNRVGVVIWRLWGERDAEAVVMLRLADFESLVGTLAAPADEGLPEAGQGVYRASAGQQGSGAGISVGIGEVGTD